ncbi:hypothetical protein [Zobellia barbeyronii]|uniref:Fibronectin type-III domain-containing protein n=1 Tax=Zobellia barbeyronii TaxID=2748009 RepID=A0ABS5WAV2_9FLAO|nr:hypothetical protein [Zobellia barbeyronii]MBT2159955.1 hypothetical protein [Zobellia barbeyronii]
MRILTFIVLSLVLFSGCKKDSSNTPGKVSLVAPAKNSECTPVQSDGDNSSIVRFNWNAADHTEVYELQVTNLNTGTVQYRNTSSTVETLSLTKGTPFSWVVVSENSETTASVSSDSWLFYNPGSEITHVPFPAELSFPVQGSTAFRDVNNEISLKWVGKDLDNDIESYGIYLSNENPPTTLLKTTDAGVSELIVEVAADEVYFWKVVTTDEEGNVSTSTVSEFKTR